MMEQQNLTGGFLPEQDVSVADTDADAVDVEGVLRRHEEELNEKKHIDDDKSHSIRPSLAIESWMFDVVVDLTSPKPSTISPVVRHYPTPKTGRRLTIQIPSTPTESHFSNLPAPLPVAYASPDRRPQSLQFTPTSPVFNFHQEKSKPTSDDDDDDAAVQEKGVRARVGRQRTHRGKSISRTPIKLETASFSTANEQPPPSLWSLMRSIYPTIPNKPMLFLGLLFCLFNGSMTPIFSFLLSRLLFEVSSGAQNVSVINHFGGLVLGIAALDGLFLGLKYYLMEHCGMSWITNLRSVAIKKILTQDKKWFDDASHSPSDIVQVVVNNGDDARNLVSVVWAQFLVVGAMLGVGLIWALTRGWQLTLAGFAIAPVFAGVMWLQTKLVVKCEARNKKAREDVARGYYDVRYFLFSFFLFFWLLTCRYIDYHQHSWYPMYGI
jgi:ATP-binding cassette subfamily B (MDR/TAP) protein 1